MFSALSDYKYRCKVLNIASVTFSSSTLNLRVKSNPVNGSLMRSAAHCLSLWWVCWQTCTDRITSALLLLTHEGKNKSLSCWESARLRELCCVHPDPDTLWLSNNDSMSPLKPKAKVCAVRNTTLQKKKKKKIWLQNWLFIRFGRSQRGRRGSAQLKATFSLSL